MNSKSKYTKEELWEKQSNAIRDPAQVSGSSNFTDCGIVSDSLKHKVDDSFVQLLSKMKITLLISREYEHLLIGLNAENNKLNQTFTNLPHPSGIAINRKTNTVYVASTRNPNRIIEFKTVKSQIDGTVNSSKVLMPLRAKYFPGKYYFHDLAFIGEELHGTSVGQNGIVKIDFNSSEHDKLIWFPRCVEDENQKPNTKANYIQLNSITAGSSIEKSFFSASSDKISKRRPGHKNYQIDKKGVIFSGKTRDVIARGLTRPHSARFYKGKIWVNNSGYGEVGFIENEKFVSAVKLPGWTRGLCFYKNIMFVGVSRVLDRFKQYAPGLKNVKQQCGIYAINTENFEILGSINWLYGNQIFGIEFIDSSNCSGFLHKKVQPSTENEKNFYYKYFI